MRWELKEPHYLFGTNAKYMKEEVNMDTKKLARHFYDVPEYHDAGTVVYQGRPLLDTDVPFTGEPTPAMEALDDEAQALSDKFRPKWISPIDNAALKAAELAPETMLMMQAFAKEIGVQIAAGQNTPVPEGLVSRAEFEETQKQLSALLAEKAKAKPEDRRV